MTAPSRSRTITWNEPVPDLREFAAMSGLDYLRQVMGSAAGTPPIGATLDFHPVRFEHGLAVFEATPAEFHYNPLGTVHGGVFATLLDSACGCAVHTMLPAGIFYTSLDLSVKFLRPVTVDTGPITAEGTVVHLGRRTALAEGRITDAAGKVYVTATSSCLLLRPEQ
jgi:uncharacterized protein (TIGR00369 family)